MKKKKRIVRVIAIVLAVLTPIFTASAFAAFGEEETEKDADTVFTEKYAKPDINELTGQGEEPEELSVSAGAKYVVKEWYEYIAYSEHAVASYRINDNNRLLFYDPYTYTNSMIMDVEYDAATTEFDTMSSYTISYTNSRTLSSSVSSTYTTSDAIQSSGRDVTHANAHSEGENKTIYKHKTVADNHGKTVTTNNGTTTVKDDTWTVSETITVGFDLAEKFESATNVTTDFGTVTTTYNNGSETEYKNGTTTNYSGEDTVETESDSKTDGWTELSDRITKTLGSSYSTNNSWSEAESTTISKTYAATHFSTDGVTPLPWAIVHYSVQMPMKCCLQFKYGGEWITVSTAYCMLTTIKGTCRAWIENGQTYYEDWGNGEPVVATDFWSQFMTKDQLINAYTNKLYPIGGDD